MKTVMQETQKPMFTEKMVTATAPMLEGIVAQPFLQELAAGTLAQERFVRYMQQDALYLGVYARVLALLASKAPDADSLVTIANFATRAVVVERQLHTQFLVQFAAPPATQMGAACLAYTSFLMAQVASEPFCVGMAAVLPIIGIELGAVGSFFGSAGMAARSTLTPARASAYSRR